jgi:hypothetical protein
MDETDDNMVWNGSEEDENVRSEHDMTDSGDSDNDWYR